MYISYGIVLSRIKWDFIRKHKPKITTLKRNKIFKMYLFLLIYWCNIILCLLTNHAFIMIFNVIFFSTIHLLIICKHIFQIFSLCLWLHFVAHFNTILPTFIIVLKRIVVFWICTLIKYIYLSLALCFIYWSLV